MERIAHTTDLANFAPVSSTWRKRECDQDISMDADVWRRVYVPKELYGGAVWDKLLRMLLEKINRIGT